MKGVEFNLNNHPKNGRRKSDLDPFQKGLIKKTRKYNEKKRLGDEFEEKICNLLRKEFSDDVVISDVIFESGNYIETLKVYESLQMDILLVTSVGLFCIEAKWISNAKYARLSGGTLSKHWTLKTIKGTRNSENNGLKQNYRHIQFLREVFNQEKINCPVYQITVIGDLNREKIAVQQFIDANLVTFDEIVDRVKYIKQRNKKKKVDVKRIEQILNDWKCTVPGSEILHIVYVRNIEKKKLPKRCKKKMRTWELES